MRRTCLVALLVVATGCETTHHARVRDGAGLDEGSPVTISGVRVGAVRSVHVVEGEVDVEFAIERDHEVTLRDDSCAFALRREGEGATLLIIPGEGAPLTEERAIPQCELATDGLGDIANQLGGALGDILRELGSGLFGGGPGGGGGGALPLPPMPSLPGLPGAPSPPPSPTGPPAPDPGSPPPPPSFDGACEGLRLSVERVEAARAVPVHLPDGGQRVWLEVHNDSDRTMRVGSIAQATFMDGDRRSLTPVQVPGEEEGWFMPFDVPARGSARRSVLFGGRENPGLAEIEARRSAPSADPLAWCTLRATGLAAP